MQVDKKLEREVRADFTRLSCIAGIVEGLNSPKLKEEFDTLLEKWLQKAIKLCGSKETNPKLRPDTSGETGGCRENTRSISVLGAQDSQVECSEASSSGVGLNPATTAQISGKDVIRIIDTKIKEVMSGKKSCAIMEVCEHFTDVKVELLELEKDLQRNLKENKDLVGKVLEFINRYNGIGYGECHVFETNSDIYLHLWNAGYSDNEELESDFIRMIENDFARVCEVMVNNHPIHLIHVSKTWYKVHFDDKADWSCLRETEYYKDMKGKLIKISVDWENYFSEGKSPQGAGSPALGGEVLSPDATHSEKSETSQTDTKFEEVNYSKEDLEKRAIDFYNRFPPDISISIADGMAKEEMVDNILKRTKTGNRLVEFYGRISMQHIKGDLKEHDHETYGGGIEKL